MKNLKALWNGIETIKFIKNTLFLFCWILFCTNYSFLALDSLFLRPVPINRKIHFDILGGSTEKFAFSSSIADSQTWSNKHWKTWKYQNCRRKLHFSFEDGSCPIVSWTYWFSGDDIGMTCYCSGAIGISHAVTCQHKQLFDGKCEHLLGAWSETNLIRLITAIHADKRLRSFGNMCARSASVPCKDCAGVLICSNSTAETSERKCLKQSDADFCQGAGWKAKIGLISEDSKIVSHLINRRRPIEDSEVVFLFEMC